MYSRSLIRSVFEEIVITNIRPQSRYFVLVACGKFTQCTCFTACTPHILTIYLYLNSASVPNFPTSGIITGI